VDGIILTASSNSLLWWVIDALTAEFSMNDLGTLHHFLGVSVTQHSGSLFSSQCQYMADILKRAEMSDCKPCSTLVDTCAKLSSDGTPVSDVTQYRGLVSTLHLTFTRLDIAYVAQQVCLYVHDPWEPHLTLVKQILQYIRGTLEFGLPLHCYLATDLVAYFDVDWVSCPDTRRSTSGYGVFLRDNLVSWSSKRSTLSPTPVSKPNTAVLPIPSLKLLGCASYLKNFTHLCVELLLFTATTSLLFISQPTQCNSNALSTLRLICTLFATRLLQDLFVFFMYPPPLSMQMSSPRGFLRRSL
jgi:hypothetical protein